MIAGSPGAGRTSKPRRHSLPVSSRKRSDVAAFTHKHTHAELKKAANSEGMERFPLSLSLYIAYAVFLPNETACLCV